VTSSSPRKTSFLEVAAGRSSLKVLTLSGPAPKRSGSSKPERDQTMTAGIDERWKGGKNMWYVFNSDVKDKERNEDQVLAWTHIFYDRKRQQTNCERAGARVVPWGSMARSALCD